MLTENKQYGIYLKIILFPLSIIAISSLIYSTVLHANPKIEEPIQSIYELQWSRNLRQAKLLSSPVQSEKKIVQSGGKSNKVYALHNDSGEILWTAEIDGQITDPVTVSENHVFVGSRNKKMYALNLTNGKKIWSRKVNGPIAGSPIVENKTVFIGTRSRYIYALDRDTGYEKWKYELNDIQKYWAPNLTKGNQSLFFGTEKNFFSLDMKTGRMKWKVDQPINVYRGGATVIGKTVYFGSKPSRDHPSTFIAVNSETGDVRWAKETSLHGMWSAASIQAGRLYVWLSASNYEYNYKLYCFNRFNGNVIWERGITINGETTGLSTPVVYDENVYIISASYSNEMGRLMILDSNKGNILFSKEISKGIPSLHHCTMANGRIYFSTFNDKSGTVYSIELESFPIPSWASWPMMGQNSSRTYSLTAPKLTEKMKETYKNLIEMMRKNRKKSVFRVIRSWNRPEHPFSRFCRVAASVLFKIRKGHVKKGIKTWNKESPFMEYPEHMVPILKMIVSEEKIKRYLKKTIKRLQMDSYKIRSQAKADLQKIGILGLSYFRSLDSGKRSGFREVIEKYKRSVHLDWPVIYEKIQ